MTHPYFVDKAKALFTARSGDPDNAGALAAWAERVRPSNDSRLGVLVALDGTLIAETRHIPSAPSTPGAAYVRVALGDVYGELVDREVGLATGQASTITGQPVIHVKFSEVCTGHGNHIQQ
jgi:hypothetical protein